MAGPSAPQISPQAVLALLERLTASNPSHLRDAEAELTKMLVHPTVLSPLMHLTCTHPAPAIRQLSAILLRRTLKVHFPKLAPEHRQEFKNLIIARIPVEDHAATLRALIALCTTVCRVENALWPALTQVAVELSASQSAPLRATTFTVFNSLCDSMPAHVVPHLPAIITLLASGLQDPDASVRVAALRAYNAAITPAATHEEGSLVDLTALLPSVVAVAAGFPSRHTDEFSRLVSAVFEVLTLITDAASGAHVKPYFDDACRFALQLLASDANATARSSANEFLIFAASSKPKTMRKAGIALAAVQTAIKLAFDNADAAAGPLDEEEDDYDSQPVLLSLRLVDALAKRPELTKIVFPEVVTAVQRGFEAASNAQNRFDIHAAGYRLIGAVAEGSSSELTVHAQEIVAPLVKGAMDEHAHFETRARALEALGLVCQALDTDEMPDDVTAEVSNAALTAVLTGMGHNELFVKKHACMSLEPVITLFKDTEALHRRLGDVIQALGGLGVDAAVEAVMAVGVLAEHASDAFAESGMYKDVIEGTIRLMGGTGEEDALARAAAVETAGVLVSACKDRTVIEKLAQHAIRGLEDDDPTIKQATYSFFARMADAVGGSVVAVFGQKILAAAMESIEREDIQFIPDEGAKDNVPFGADVEDEEEGVGQGSFRVRSAYLDEKTVATAVVGAFATACATDGYVSAVAPSLETAQAIRELFVKSVMCIDDMTTYFHEDVRASAFRSLSRLCAANVYLMDKHPSLAFGDEKLVANSFGRLEFGLKEDDEVWVVTNVLTALGVFFTQIPAKVLNVYKNSILDAVEILIAGEAVCQISNRDEFIDGGYEDADSDEVGGLVEALGDVVESFARSLRGYFAKDFSQLLRKMLSALYSNTESARNKGMVLGAVAGVLLFLNWDKCPKFPVPGKGTTEYELALQTSDDTAAILLPLALDAVRSTKSKTLQRNAVFLTGIIFSKTRASKREVWGLLPQALNVFEEIIRSGKRGNGALVDNAAGAVSRIMSAPGLPSGSMSNRKLMLYAVLNCVPLEDDPVENTTVARGVLHMAKSDFDCLMEPAVVQNVASCLVSAILVYGEAVKKGPKVIWVGSDTDPNNEIVSLDESEVKDLIGLSRKLKEAAGDSVFAKLGLSKEDEQSFSGLVRMYSN